MTKSSDKSSRQGNKGVLYLEPIARLLPNLSELIDKSVEPKQSINSTPNVDFEENSPIKKALSQRHT